MFQQHVYFVLTSPPLNGQFYWMQLYFATCSEASVKAKFSEDATDVN